MHYTDASSLVPIALDAAPNPGRLTRALQTRCAGSPFYDGRAIATITEAYLVACEQARLDVILALAQMTHETGNLSSWWAARPRRNPAGIGVTGAKRRAPDPNDPAAWHPHPDGRYHRGYVYASWAPDPALPGPCAVEAHISRLLWYAQPASFDVRQQALYDRGARDRGMPAAARGSARTLRELGWAHNRARLRGMGWAFPGWSYGQRVAEHANAIRGLL